jgi:CheY-like chemotaxis protein
MKHSFDRTRNGCPVQAAVLVVFFACLRVWACHRDALWHEPRASFAFVVEPQVAALYGLCAIVLVLMVMAAVRWAHRRRWRPLRQRNDEVFQQIDEWTKSLQQVYFPVADQAPLRPEEAASLPEVRGGNETILVAEDERVLRELVREILTAYGYRVLEAADGVEALTVWDENRGKVDLLLTDMVMPRDLSGRDLAEKLRKDDPRLPVVFSSGYSQEMIQRSDDTVPGAVYLSKPYLPAELAQTVRHALDAARNRDTPAATPASLPS